MLAYIGIGAGVASVRLLLERSGKFQYARQDAVWVLATAFTDVFWWPLVIMTLLLRRAAHSPTG